MLLVDYVPRGLLRKSTFALAALAGASACFAGTPGVGYETGGDRIVFTVDVAEDFDLFETTFLRLTSMPSQPEPLFFSEGRIFPAGTIQGEGVDFDPNAGGSIGRWLCRGTRIGPAFVWPEADDAQIQTSQVYLFPDDTRALATEGIEGDDTDVRTISYGTGMYRGFVGEQRQEFLGYNATGGVNLRVMFILERRK